MAGSNVPGWGSGPYGRTPWAGSSTSSPGGPLPYDDPFDIYCVGENEEISTLDSYSNVGAFVAAGQLSIEPTTQDFRMQSGGASADTTARLLLDVAVPGSWTFDMTFKAVDLPSDFASLKDRHFFVGTADDNGYCAGLFFSLLGIGYTGSTSYDNVTGELILNSTFQVLPNSLNLVQEDIYYTLRVVIDAVTETTFIYITDSAQLPLSGHQLRYILPAIPSSSCVVTPEDGTTLSVKGTAAAPSTLDIHQICLGTGVLTPNLPPIADAGTDQAARFCTVVRLDGTRSYDPEGVQVTYAWRLVDGPEASENVFAGYDGITYTPSPYTNKLYSEELEAYHASIGIVPGDVLLVRGTPYDIIAVGSDGNGFYVQIVEFSLPANSATLAYKLLRQNTINGRMTSKPTFYPDAVGLYKFELVVFDGQYNSAPSLTVVNVVESAIARGTVPDLSFLWSYLSDFWRLVENRGVIETFWSALAQVTASELLTLWQHEYGKSLRDIQRTFQRKWLHYDFYLQDPVTEQSTTRVLYGGVLSDDITGSTTITGKTIDVESPVVGNFQLYFSGTTLTPSALADELQRLLNKKVSGFSVTLHENTAANTWRILVTASFPFTFQDTSTLPVFSYPVVNDLPRGTGGAAVGVNTYRVDRSLTGLDVSEGDYLVTGDNAYRIVRVIDDSTDTWRSQRVVLADDLPFYLPSDWVICGKSTSSYLDFYNALVTRGDIAYYEVIDSESNDPLYIPVRVLGAASFREDSYLLCEQQALYPYFAQPARYSVYFYSVYRRSHLPVSEYVVEVPTLQEFIKNSDEQALLRQNIDYFVETYRGSPCLRFVTGEAPELDVWGYEQPPQRMWAETTYLDNRPTIEQNFGVPAEFTLDDLAELPDTTDYLSVVRGLWYTYFNGPTLYNLRVGTQILLGLPFAEENGVITEIRTDFSTTLGRILVQDSASTEIVRSYTYPRELELEINPATGELYKEGDTVTQFSPLVKGVDVVDYVKNPTWYEGYLNQGVFFEVEKFFKFLVRVDSEAFSLQTLLFARSFVLRIKPTYTFPLFIVRSKVGDTTVDVTDEIAITGRLKLFDVPCSDWRGMGGIIDDPDPSGGGWQTQLDSAYPLEAPPTYPTAANVVPWGGDKNYLCPEDFVMATSCITLVAPTFPTLDSIYVTDLGVFSETAGVFGNSGLETIDPTPGRELGFPVTLSGSANISTMEVEYEVGFTEDEKDVQVVLNVNGVDVRTITFTIPAGTYYRNQLPVTPLALNNGDVLLARLEAQGAGVLRSNWATVAVKLGVVQTWALDTQMPAGTYCMYKLM